MEDDTPSKWQPNKVGTAIFIQDKVDFRPKKLMRDRDEDYIVIIKEKIHRDIIVIKMFFFFGHIHSMRKFSGQGLNLSCSYDLRHSCSNTGSLASCAWPGIKLVLLKIQAGSLTHCATARTLIIINIYVPKIRAPIYT